MGLTPPIALHNQSKMWLCVWVGMYMCVQMCVCINVCVYVHVYVYMNVCVCTCVRSCMYVCGGVSSIKKQSKQVNIFMYFNTIEAVCLKQGTVCKCGQCSECMQGYLPVVRFKCQSWRIRLRREGVQDLLASIHSSLLQRLVPFPFSKGCFVNTLQLTVVGISTKTDWRRHMTEHVWGFHFVFYFTLKNKASRAFKMWKIKVQFGPPQSESSVSSTSQRVSEVQDTVGLKFCLQLFHPDKLITIVR